MGMNLYDTARGEVVPFQPGPKVSMYVCGITPYDATHLGHAFTYLTFDLVIRRSFADYLRAWLQDAAMESGLEQV